MFVHVISKRGPYALHMLDKNFICLKEVNFSSCLGIASAWECI